LAVGSVLDVVANTAGVSSTLEVHYLGSLAGALTFPGVFDILNCILRGVKYQATITSITAGQYVVQVDPI
jgi:hypothetical protein